MKWFPAKETLFSRPLIIIESDDWGRVGVRDREGADELRAKGLSLGERPYDFYTLETAEGVSALHQTLLRHRDSIGRPACVVMNFVVANLDFEKIQAEGFRKLFFQPLAAGLPGKWTRPGLFDAYRRGISDGTFYPALHGTSHFCRPAVEAALKKAGPEAAQLQTLWQSQAPYIYWRMPWVGYEYWNPGENQFLDAAEQETLIAESVELFRKMFGTSPLSACAPGYRANHDTERGMEKCGIRIIQNGSGGSAPIHMLPIHMDREEVLHLYRNVDFEPATAGSTFSLAECFHRAQRKLDHGEPAIVSVHAINFHNSLRDFATPTLTLLDEFLTLLEAEYPDLLYLNDADLYRLISCGSYDGLPDSARVIVRQQSDRALFSAVLGARA